jgi:hypothetical protein
MATGFAGFFTPKTQGSLIVLLNFRSIVLRAA